MTSPLTDSIALMRWTLASCAEWITWTQAANATAAQAYIHRDAMDDAAMATLPRCLIITEEHEYIDGIGSGAFKLVFYDHTTGDLAADVAAFCEHVGALVKQLWNISRSGTDVFLGLRSPPRLAGHWNLAPRTEDADHRTIRQEVLCDWGLERG
jgi:hypothetical protein